MSHLARASLLGLDFWSGSLDLAEHERNALLQSILRHPLTGDRLDDDDPFRVVVLGVERGLERVEDPQVAGIIGERELLAGEELEVVERPLAASRQAHASLHMPESSFHLLHRNEPVQEGRHRFLAAQYASLFLVVATPQVSYGRLDGIRTELRYFLVIQRTELLNLHQTRRDSTSGSNGHIITSSVKFRPTLSVRLGGLIKQIIPFYWYNCNFRDVVFLIGRSRRT